MEVIPFIAGVIIGTGVVLAVLALKPSPPKPVPELVSAMVYDFECVSNVANLRSTLGLINADRYELIAVTQSGDSYTIIFRRPMHG